LPEPGCQVGTILAKGLLAGPRRPEWITFTKFVDRTKPDGGGEGWGATGNSCGFDRTGCVCIGEKRFEKDG
jgi:hypothetical protein